MDDDKQCDKCPDKHTCKEAYQQLGQYKGPSVIAKAMLVFLLPLVVFIAAVSIGQHFLVHQVESTKLRMFLSFLIAVIFTFIVILVTSFLSNKIFKKLQGSVTKNE